MPSERDQQNWTEDSLHYDIAQGEKKYNQLLRENIWLKQLMEQQQRANYPSQALYRNTEQPPYESYDPLPKRGQFGQYDQAKIRNHASTELSGMIEKNRFLQRKLERLKIHYGKQMASLDSIRHSQIWRNRGCGSNSCYQDKYMELLRIKSPFY